MHRLTRFLRAGLPVLILAVGASPAMAGDTPAPTAAKAKATSTASTRGQSSPVATQPLVIVHKSPTCGCCGKWVEHLRTAGFKVDVRDTVDMGAVKDRVGIPPAKGSCHTAEVAGYFVEGHVPAEDVRRLLAERPDARGLTVPGMPMGSPGMEVPSGETPAYSVLLVNRDGSTVEYARHGNGAAPVEAHDHGHDHAH